MTKPTPQEAADYKLANEYRDAVFRRTGIERHELECPRENSFMTPCVARDGESAVAFTPAGRAVCAGCECGVNDLYTEEMAKHPDT